MGSSEYGHCHSLKVIRVIGKLPFYGNSKSGIEIGLSVMNKEFENIDTL